MIAEAASTLWNLILSGRCDLCKGAGSVELLPVRLPSCVVPEALSISHHQLLEVTVSREGLAGTAGCSLRGAMLMRQAGPDSVQSGVARAGVMPMGLPLGLLGYLNVFCN
ncbi:MAG: hypothetical protein U1E74_00485 [Paenacidovorax caeni]